MENTLLKLLEHPINRTWTRLKNDQKVLQFMQDNKLPIILDQDASFESVYRYALLKYGIEKEPKELILLFAIPEVMKAFHDELYHQDTESFESVLGSELAKDHPITRVLKGKFSSKEEEAVYGLISQISGDKAPYDKLVNERSRHSGSYL